MEVEFRPDRIIKNVVNYVNALPLTEELLIDFGCVKLEQDLFSIEANGIEIQLTFKGDGYNVDIGGIVIAFVDKMHRWQNLYEAIKTNN